MKKYKRDYKKYKSLYKTSLKGGDIRKCIVNFNITNSNHEEYWRDLYMFILEKLGIVSIQIQDIPEVLSDQYLSDNLAGPVMSNNTPMVRDVLTILLRHYPESLHTDGSLNNDLDNIRLHLGEAYSHNNYVLGQQYIWIRHEGSIVDKNDLGLAYILKFLNFGDINTVNYYSRGDTGLNTFVGQEPNTMWDNTQADDNQYTHRCPTVQTIRNPRTRRNPRKRNTTRLPSLFKWLLGFRLDTKTVFSVNNASYQVRDDPGHLGLMRYLIRDYTNTVQNIIESYPEVVANFGAETQEQLDLNAKERRMAKRTATKDWVYMTIIDDLEEQEDNIFKIGELIDNLCERSMSTGHTRNLSTHGVETVRQNRNEHLQTKNRLFYAFDVPYYMIHEDN